MALSFDGKAGSAAANAASMSATLSTTNAKDIIVAVVTYFSNNISATCTGVAGAGITEFALRSRTVLNTSYSIPMVVEVWWGCAAAALTDVSVTASFYNYASIQYNGLHVFGINGADLLNPFDPNTALPAVAMHAASGGAGTHAVTGVATTNTNTLEFAVLATAIGGSGTPTADSGFTLIENEYADGVTYGASYTEYQINTSAVSPTTQDVFAGLSSVTTNYIALIDAIQGPATADTDWTGPKFVNSGDATIFNTSTPTANMPADIVAGNLLLAHISVSAAVSGSLAWSSGWTPIEAWYAGAVAQTGAKAYRIATGSDTAPTVTWTGGGVALGMIVVDQFTNVNQTTPIGNSEHNSTNSATVTCTAVTTTANNSLVVNHVDNGSELTLPGLNGAWTALNTYVTKSGDPGQGCRQLSGQTIAASGSNPSSCTQTSFSAVQYLDFQTEILAPTPVTGTFGASGNITEATDTFYALESVYGGWASTEAKDSFFPPWTGYPEMIGTWHSTEATDKAVILSPPPFNIDGYATGGGFGTFLGPGITSASATLSTTHVDDVIVLSVMTGGYFHFSTVTSITDTAGLTWKRRNQREPLLAIPGYNVELWWAHAPAVLTDDVITVNTNPTGAISILAWGVSGANYTTPWDTHTQAGSYTDGVGNDGLSPTATEIYTNANNTLIFGVHVNNIVDTGQTQSPFNYVTSVINTEASGYALFESMAYAVVDTPQSNLGITFGRLYGGSTVYAGSSVLADAIVASGETGTADPVFWFPDAGWANNITLLTTGRDLQLNYTSYNKDLVVLCTVMIQSASGLGTVTSIESGASPTFERRSRRVEGTLALEVWWAYYPSPVSSDIITINTSGTAAGDIVSAFAFGLGGTTYSYGSGEEVWDGDGSLPALNSSGGASPPPNVTDISTINAHTLLVAFTGNLSEVEQGFTPPFVTLIPQAGKTIAPSMYLTSEGPPTFLGFEYMYADTQVTNMTAEFLTSPEPDGWLMIGDAIAVGPPVPATGTWASTEHTDIFTALGFLTCTGTWASTEHTDKFTGAPALAPYDSIGWLGWVPAYAAWTSTERTDTMSFDGWVIGTGLTGQIGAVEHKDRFGATDWTSVTGTWGSVEAKDRWASAGFEVPLLRVPPVPRQRRLLIIT